MSKFASMAAMAALSGLAAPMASNRTSGTRYRVCQGCCVLLPNSEPCKGGELLPMGMHSDAWIQEQLRDRRIEVTRNTEEHIHDVLADRMPGNTPLPALVTGDAKDEHKALLANAAGQIITPNAGITIGGPVGQNAQPVPRSPEGQKTDSPEVKVPEEAPPVETVEPQNGKDASGAPAGKWNLDPKAIKTKTLEELNIIVLERDPAVAPFADIGEARAWLTQDFGKAAG